MIQGKPPSQNDGMNDGIRYIEIPKGWSRVLENGSIHYISPSSSYLKSYEHIIEYLKKDGTCKCGLDCPFHVHRVFSFDASVQNKERKDELATNNGHSTTCKLCDSNWQKGKSFVDSRMLQKPLNQTLKTAKKSAQFSFDGNLNKKVVNRSRAKLSDGPKTKKARKVSSPLSDIPSPPPIPISSPVQNVPNNLGGLNQGPLPSFASIVSSSKFFNPGPNRGPLHPTGSLPLHGNNKFAFPKILTPNISNAASVNTITPSSSIAAETTVAASTSVANSTIAKISAPNAVSATVPSIVQNTTSRASKDKKLVLMETFSSSASSFSTVTTQSSSNISYSGNVLPNTVSNAVCLIKTGSTPTISNSKTVVMPVISTPTLPSVFAPLDGVSSETVKTTNKPKPRTRPRPSRAKPKQKPEMKLDNKSKMAKRVTSTPPVMSPGIVNPGVASLPVSSHWPVSHVPYQTPSTTVVTPNNASNTSSIATSHITGNMPRSAVPQQCLPQQVTMPSSIYMTANYPNQGSAQAMQISSTPVSNLQVPQPLTSVNQNTSTVGNATSAPSATPSSTYSVVATPRIQAPPPGMMYVAAAPSVGMFSPGYPYAAAAQPLQITQAPVSQQSKTTTTTVASASQQPVTQGMSSESAQGKISFQVPGMYVQGATGNQMFPINPQGFGVNQYKTPYQIQSTLYPNAGNAMTFITPNGAKAAYPGIQTVATGNIGQFAYPNPYMFGIVMPTTTNQQSTASNTSSSPATPTSTTTSLQMIQPQGIQNPAVAAAFESFVPIAPAAGGPVATPRFAQTLAHLASAYNTFPQAGLVQGANQFQLAYQMMQMNPHAQQVANLGGLGTSDTTSKHPISSSGKQGSSSSDAAKGGSTKSKSSSDSPGTPISQDHSGGPFASSHATTSSLPTSPHCASSPTSLSQTQQSTSKSVYSQEPQENSPESVPCSIESKSTTDTVPGQQSPGSKNETLRHESDNAWKNELANVKANSLSSSSISHGIEPLTHTNGPTDKSDSQSISHCNMSPLGKQKNTALYEIDKQDESPGTETQNYHQQVMNDNRSPVRTPNIPYEQNKTIPVETPGQPKSHCPEQEFPSEQHNASAKRGVHEPKTPTKTIDNRKPSVKSHVDKVNYYETNPLLGMKRSCEAIEVYPDLPESLDEDDKEDYYSSNEESPEGVNPFQGGESTTDCALDLRHGDSSNMEDSFRIGGQVQSVTKGLHNGGCSATLTEQEKFLGSKPAQNLGPFRPDVFGDLPIPHIRPHFDIDDVVWAQARGLPSWPGKIVDETKVGKGKADDGKKWVMWFGDHTFSQVEVDRLKTLNEGLRSLDDKARKKKYRAKKARISLEQAITEALEELEMREQLKARQAGMRSKAKKKRLR